MFVIEVIPLKRGVQIDTLSYYSSAIYERGTILKVPVRNQEILGVVVDTKEVSTTKTAIKAATFSLKKLPLQENVQKLSPAYIKTAEELALYYATSVGAVLYNLLPPDIRSGDIPLPHTHHIAGTHPFVPEVLTASTKERHLSYRSLVRETFAHSGSVLCVVPSSAEAEELYEYLSNGITDRTIMLTSTMTKKQLREAYALLDDFSKPKLIITTPSHAVLERHDITLLIIERARSPYYKELVRPYLDYRDVLTVHAKYAGRRTIFADLLPRSEEEYKRRNEIYQTHGEHPKRLEFGAKLHLLNTNEKTDGATPFKLFSPKVVETIKDVLKKRGHIFLFAARRGLAPVVACLDCGFIFRSPESGAPYSLLRTKKNGVEERWFVCSVSGHRERAHEVCTACGSWRLRERGIGIQYVYDELGKLLPKTPIMLFDHTTASTHKKALFLKEKFYGTKGAIMIGTSMAVPYLTNPIDISVIVNVDALYATPTWRLQEENFALMLRLREISKDALYVQTRTKDDTLIEHAKHANIEQFYTEEIELRKTFNYPPFTTFIHLTWQGPADAVQKTEALVSATLKDYKVSVYNAIQSPKDTVMQFGLIRMSSKDWPDKRLSLLLRSLPPTIRIVINPDRIV